MDFKLQYEKEEGCQWITKDFDEKKIEDTRKNRKGHLPFHLLIPWQPFHWEGRRRVNKEMDEPNGHETKADGDEVETRT